MGRVIRQSSAATPATAGLDFTRHRAFAVRRYIVRRLPELDHIDLDFVAIRVCQARSRARHGIYASLTPLRFRDGVPYDGSSRSPLGGATYPR